jgi:RNA polymerase sigma-70 factor, ECF subfamily
MTSSAQQQPGDAELLRRVADADPHALRMLYDRHAPWLLLRLRQRCSDAALADEVLQETFCSVWRSAGQFRSDDVGGWMWTIAARRLVDAVRSRTSQRRLLDRLSLRREERAPSAEDQVLVGLEHGDLYGALNRLSPDLRAVLQAVVLDGLSTAEAAELLGIPRNTVKTRAMRARKHLRRELAAIRLAAQPAPISLDGER